MSSFISNNYSFEQVLIGAEIFLKILDKYKIQYSKNRWSNYIERISLLEEARKGGKIEEFLKKEPIPKIILTLMELQDLGFIAKFENILPDGFKISKFKKMIEGNDFLIDETVDTNQARNTQFELVMAIYCVLGGYEIEQKDITDIPLKRNDEYSLIECKRPFTEVSLGQNIDNAVQQLQKRFTNYENSNGFVAISFQRIIPKVTGYSTVKTNSEGEAYLNKLCQHILKKYRKYWAKIIDLRIIGIIIYLNFPVYIIDENRFTGVGYIFGNNIFEKNNLHDASIVKANNFFMNIERGMARVSLA
ncbi:MAG: hypothetical protein PHD29_08855 [bacterium]|nr:hypothetical protein [bacterium]